MYLLNKKKKKKKRVIMCKIVRPQIYVAKYYDVNQKVK